MTNRQTISRYAEIPAFTTKDGSIIRELMHPDRHAARHQSLAEAIIPIGEKTLLHRHKHAEELYYITAGEGDMTLGESVFPVSAGDTVCIIPGTAHCIRNTGNVELKLLCACSPAYSHEDTELLKKNI